jgi:hypothetical protein
MPRWTVVLVGGFGILVLGALIGWSLGRQGESADADKLRRVEARLAEADENARELVEALGPLCGNFDFWFKHDMARGAFRPVRCSKRGEDKTVVLAYGFDTERTREAWASEWGGLTDRRGATLVTKGRWATEVLDPLLVDQVQSVVLKSR